MADSTIQTSRQKSAAAFARARTVMPGGVNSPVRAYQAVGAEPVFIREGRGACVVDLDGNEYTDYVGSYGPLILGHAHDAVVAAISKAAMRGATFGMPTEAETQLAEAVISAVPSIDVVRFVNSGTEATMSAIRLARAATGKPRIIKCVGCYHGHVDPLLVQAGSGATTLGSPSSPGVPEGVTQYTSLVPYNDLQAVEAVLGEYADVAAIAVEPVAGNMGCVPPEDGYLEGLRTLCDRYDVLLIFDEVMSGFRVAYGGAQSRYGVSPDLTCLGKVVGGGLPCAAYGGRGDLMRQVSPDGPVYQAGTLSGNPLAMAAGIATLEALRENDGRAYVQLEASAKRLAERLVDAAENHGRGNVPVQVQRVGSMICCFFSDKSVRNYDDATACDTERFAQFFRGMLERGVLLPPSQFETWFVSLAHDAKVVDQTIEKAGEVFAEMAAA